MTALAYDAPVTELGAMMRRLEVALRDREWEDCPVGREVARFIDALEWHDSSPNTIRAYEHVLGLLALRHSDWGGVEEFCSAMGTEYLREFLSAEWGSCAPSTKKRQVAVVHSFFAWLVDERRISYDPSRTIKGPRVDRRAKRMAYPLETLGRLVRAQDSDRDAAALQILCRLGLRRAELREVTVGEIDLIRGFLFVHGKGRKDELQPLPSAWLEETHPVNLHLRHRDAREYLLYARNRKFERMSLAGVHNWFKRCVRKAGLPESMTLHEMRHSAADNIRLERGDVSLATQPSLRLTLICIRPSPSSVTRWMRWRRHGRGQVFSSTPHSKAVHAYELDITPEVSSSEGSLSFRGCAGLPSDSFVPLAPAVSCLTLDPQGSGFTELGADRWTGPCLRSPVTVEGAEVCPQ